MPNMSKNVRNLRQVDAQDEVDLDSKRKSKKKGLLSKKSKKGKKTSDKSSKKSSSKPPKDSSSSHDGPLSNVDPVAIRRSTLCEGDLRQFGEFTANMDMVLGESDHVRVVGGRDEHGGAVAIKILERHEMDEAELAGTYTEADVLGYLSKSAQIGDALDNGIVKLFGFMEYDDLIVVIYERSFGKLLDQMMTKFSDGLTETKARSVITRLALSMERVHQLGVAHLNLNVANLIVISENDTAETPRQGAPNMIKILDFSMAIRMEGASGSMCNKICGSLGYASPEVMEGREYNPYAADVWSMGIILFAILTNKLPFTGMNPHQVLDDIDRKTKKKKKPQEGLRSYLSKELKHCSEGCIDALCGMLCVDPAFRLTMKQVMKHPWMVEGATQLNKRMEEASASASATSAGSASDSSSSSRSSKQAKLTPQQLSRQTPLTIAEQHQLYKLNKTEKETWHKRRERRLWQQRQAALAKKKRK